MKVSITVAIYSGIVDLYTIYSLLQDVVVWMSVYTRYSRSEGAAGGKCAVDTRYSIYSNNNKIDNTRYRMVVYVVDMEHKMSWLMKVRERCTEKRGTLGEPLYIGAGHKGLEIP